MRIQIGRFTRRTLIALALGATAAAGSLLVPADAVAQSTTRPEFNVGMKLTAKTTHTVAGIGEVKAGTELKVAKVTQSGGKIVYLNIQLLPAGAKAEKVPVAFVRANYNYQKL